MVAEYVCNSVVVSAVNLRKVRADQAANCLNQLIKLTLVLNWEILKKLKSLKRGK